MAGGNPTEERQARDFYPSPWEVSRALILAQSFEGGIWEPACGDWAMAGEFEKAGYKVLGSDIEPLTPRGVKADFLSIHHDCSTINIVTNPPFDLAQDFIRHALSMNPRSLSLVLKASYWHAKTRRSLWDEFKPTVIHPLTWRPDFLGLGRPTMEVMWCVWRQKCSPVDPQYVPLYKPAAPGLRR